MKYIEKSSIVDAFQWFKNGDHPEDDVMRAYEDTGKLPDSPREGKVVRYFRHPAIDGEYVCESCGKTMNQHGYLDTGYGGLTICPGDWIIREYENVYTARSPSGFEAFYIPVDSCSNTNTLCN